MTLDSVDVLSDVEPIKPIHFDSLIHVTIKPRQISSLTKKANIQQV